MSGCALEMLSRLQKSFYGIGFIAIAVAGSAMCSDYLPDPRLAIGMPFEQVEATFPDLKRAYSIKDDNGLMTNGIALVNFNRKRYWDSALMHIEEAKIKTMSFVFGSHPLSSTNEISNILADLREAYGTPKERFVVYGLGKKGSIRSPAVAWETTNSIIVFTHPPTKCVKNGEPLRCQLTFLEDKGQVPYYFDVATDSVPDDPLLFEPLETSADSAASEENTGAF